MRAVVLLAILITYAAPGAAQDTVPTEKRVSLKIPTLVFAASATADWVTTAYFLREGVRESNPMLRWTDDHPVRLIALGAALDVAGVVAWNHFVGRNHPKIAAIGLYAMSAWRFSTAVDNLYYTTPAEQERRLRREMDAYWHVVISYAP